MPVLVSLLSGALFGLGLVFSGLIAPEKVRAFLDIAGAWDPSLAVTMAVAVATTAVGYRAAFAAGRPAFDCTFHLPAQSDIDMRLLAGAALFGIGWGLVGYCPGPAIAALSLGSAPTTLFVVAMVAGMALQRVLQQRSAPGVLPIGTPRNTTH
jgi:uncharacterized membrane protein YedE/YeeE